MPRQFLTDVDLKASLQLAGSAGTAGQVLTSGGPSGLPSWQTPSLVVADGDKGDITITGGVWSIDNGVVTYAKIQNVSVTDRILGRSSAGAGTVEEITCTAAGRALIDDADAAAQRTTLGVAADYTITTTAIDKTLTNRERCTVTAFGRTVTLPATPSAGWEVSVTVSVDAAYTVIERNGENIMSLAEDLTIDRSNATVTLYYVNATLGWRLI